MFTSADTLSAVADVQTIGQLRAAIGTITEYLNLGYAQLPNISADQGLRAQVQANLDDQTANANALYVKQPSDVPAQNYEVGFIDAGSLGILASQTEDVLGQVAEAAKVSDFQFGPALAKAVGEYGAMISGAAEGIGSTVGNVAAAPFKGLVAAGAAFVSGAKVFLIVGGLIAVVYIFRAPLTRALGKVGA